MLLYHPRGLSGGKKHKVGRRQICYGMCYRNKKQCQVRERNPGEFLWGNHGERAVEEFGLGGILETSCRCEN